MKYHCPQCGSKRVRIEDAWLICESCGRIWRGYLKHLWQRISSLNESKKNQKEKNTMKSPYEIPRFLLRTYISDSSFSAKTLEKYHLPSEEKDKNHSLKKLVKK